MNDTYSIEMREGLLGDYLRFLNTLSATHPTVRAVLASDQWFTTLLKVVDMDAATGMVGGWEESSNHPIDNSLKCG